MELLKLITLSLLISSSPSFAQAAAQCERALQTGKAFSEERPSLKLTVGQKFKIPKTGHVWNFNFEWKYADYEKARGRIFSNGMPEVPCEFLLPEDLSRDELKLARYLEDRSQRSKFVDRDWSDEAKGNWIKSHPQGPKPNIEYAAWRVELKSGEVVTVPHSSSQMLGVGKRHGVQTGSDSLDKVMADRHFGWSDISVIQYFHTHPEDPLPSLGDLNFMKDRQKAAEGLGVHLPFHIYSIGTVEGKMVVGHVGVP